MPRRAQNPLLVQEVMEEEWSALRARDSCPEALTQVRMGHVLPERVLQHREGLPCVPWSSGPSHPPSSSP